MEKFLSILKKFPKLSIGVIGDIMLDHYLSGEVERISPEAPAPVVLLQEEQFLPGGAANTAANIAALGARVDVVGVSGYDTAGETLSRMLEKYRIDTKGVVRDREYPTIEKTRVLSRGQQIVRIDREESHTCDQTIEEQLRERVRMLIPTWHALVISDYAKGVIIPRLARDVLSLAQKNRIPVIVDTKPAHFSFFQNVALLTPNKKESEDIIGKKIITREDVTYAGTLLRNNSKSDVLMTLGEEGMALFSREGVFHLPSFAREVFDVTGAGDTVVAVSALALAAGATSRCVAELAGFGAGIVVGKRGTATVTWEELRSEIHYYGKKEDKSR